MRAFIYKDFPVDSRDFRLLSRSCLNGLQQMRETHRFLRGMVAWVGFPQIGIQYDRQPPSRGFSEIYVSQHDQFAWTAATSFSILPLKASAWLGVFVTLFGLGEALHALLAKSFRWYVVPGWTSLTVLISILGSATLVSVGYSENMWESCMNRRNAVLFT